MVQMTAHLDRELFCDYRFAELQRKTAARAGMTLRLSHDSSEKHNLDDLQASESGEITRIALRGKAERGALLVPSLELKPPPGIEVDLGMP